MPITGITRQVEGRIYYDKFDSLDGWEEQKDLHVDDEDWEIKSWSRVDYAAYYSSPFAVNFKIEPNDDFSGTLPSGRYLRRSRSITIPAGLSSVRMQVRHRWHQATTIMKMARKITLGAEIFLNQQATDTQDVWAFVNSTVNTSAGSQVLQIGVESYDNVVPHTGHVQYHYFDNLVVARGTTLIVSGLTPGSGYKAKLYDASDQLIAQATEVAGVATIDVSSQAYPITGRLKITDNADVVQYTDSLRDDIFGGDQYLVVTTSWVMTVETDNYIINRTGATFPTLASLTFTLKTSAGAPVSGKTVNFTTSLGTLGSSSDTTDAEGEAHTTISSTIPGIAVICGEVDSGSGDQVVYTTVEISVHYDVDDPETDFPAGSILAEYEVWVQGRRIEHVSQVHIESAAEQNVATVDVDDISDYVQGLYDFVIYRQGTKVFFGRIELVDKSVSPVACTRFQGRNMIQSLINIPIASVSYSNTGLHTLIDSIHATYVDPFRQVTLGAIEDWLDNIIVSISVTNTNAYDLLLMAAGLGGARVSVDPNRALNVG